MTELILALALSLQWLLLGRLFRRLRLLETATKHLTPDHRLDALVDRLAKDEAAILKGFADAGELLRTLAEQDKRLATALLELKTEAEETYFRKDAAN